MAGTQKKQTGKKKNTGQENKGLRYEIWILLGLFVCLLFLLSNFGMGGIVGEKLSYFQFGLFGILAWITPLLLFAGLIFGLPNGKERIPAGKLFCGTGLFLCICAFLSLCSGEYVTGTPLLSYYRSSGVYKNGGGLLGGLLVNCLCPTIGLAGTYILLVILMLIFLLLITEKPMLKNLGENSRKAYDTARDNRLQRKEEREARKEREIFREKQLRAIRKKPGTRRMDHVVPGVSFDTTLKKEEGSPSGMVELKAQEEAEGICLGGKGKQSGRKQRKSTKEEQVFVAQEVEQEIRRHATVHGEAYHFPPFSLLKRGQKSKGSSGEELQSTARKLESTLQNFGVRVTVTDVSCGPSVTRYELQPEQGVKVSRIVGLADDIKLNLAAADIRIEAPIPGKAAVGIEVPNRENKTVTLLDLLESSEFQNHSSRLAFAAGMDIAGKAVVADIATMPHILIAGATGSGKSVCINTLIMSILYKATPEEVKLVMIDPKVVELSVYNGIPHLMIPVVTDPKKAAGALNWAVAEMTRRYQLFAEYNVRDLQGFNEKIERSTAKEGEELPERLPKIVIIVDELADLMMVAAKEVEEAICRLAQLARAAGLHLVLATQRPSVNVITGLIKANMPSRIAFSVTSGVDSRTIIDMNGAEKLLGKGDMLFYPAGYQKPVRVQGSFVSDQEVQKVVSFLLDHNAQADYDQEMESQIKASASGVSAGGAEGLTGEEKDAYFIEAGRFIIEKEKASIGMLQRAFKVGFNRASRIMDQLATAGVVGPEEGTKPRKILMTLEEFEQSLEQR